MGIPRILHRYLHSISCHINMKPLGSYPSKRLLLKKNESSAIKTIVRNGSGYDADGKTVGFVLNKKNAEEILIHSYSTNSFFMEGNTELVGSMIIFPHSVFSWHISAAKDVNEDSLVLFKLMEPKIDILVFGYGNPSDFTLEVRQNFTKCCKNLGIRFEALPTEHAVGTYNFLASERRLVAAALIPPTNIDKLRFDRSPSKSKLLEAGEDEDEEELKTIDSGTPEKLIK